MPREEEIWKCDSDYTILGYKTIINQYKECILVGKFGEIWPTSTSTYTLILFDVSRANLLNKRLKIPYTYKNGEEALFPHLTEKELKQHIDIIEPYKYQGHQINMANQNRLDAKE